MPTDINRLRMKARYQWNMLMAHVCVALLVGIALVGYYVSDRTSDTSVPHATQVINLPLMIQDSAVVVHDTTRASRGALPGFNPYAYRHQGFLGFVDLRPTPTAPEPIPIPPVLYTGDADLAKLVDDSLFSYALISGTDTGVFIPVDAQLPELFESASLPSVNQEVQVVRRVDPEYPYVAREADKEGHIVVLVYVDSTGALSMFPDWVQGEGIQTLAYSVHGEKKVINYAVEEDPVGWYFADNFLKVLPRWQFKPRIVDSQPVSTLLRIKYTFCLGMNCLRYEFIPVES